MTPEPESIPTSESTLPLFVADHLALDFLNSVYGPAGGRHECLSSDEAVLEWLHQAGLPTEHAPSYKRGALVNAAVALRACVHALLLQRKAGVTGDPTDLNQALALGRSYQQLAWTSGARPQVVQRRQVDDARALLVPVAEAAAQLLVAGDFDLIRECQSPDCTLWFYDHTKAHRRRWCSMAACGNRMKVAAFRARRQADEA